MLRTATTLALILSLAGTSDLMAKAKAGKKKGSSLPAMKVLPVGSSLHGVTVPRYNSDYQRNSLFQADRINILAEQRMKGFNVDLTFYSPAEFPTLIHLNSALYFEVSGMIHSDQNLQIHAKQFDIAAQGILLDSNSRYGFLHGHTESIFYPEPSAKEASTKNSTPSKAPTAVKTPSTQTTMSTTPKKSTLLAVTAAAATTIPALLSAEELNDIDTLSKSSSTPIAAVDTQTRSENAQTLQQSNAIDSHKAAQKKTLVSTTQQDDSVSQEPKPLKVREKQPEPVQINCEDGMYFDAFNGIAVYQKDVVVTHPLYKLTCSDELKIILQAEDGSSFIQPKTGKKGEMVTPETQNISRFKNLSKAIAIGNVVINAKDSEGKPILAQAPLATYDAITGIIILKGNQAFVEQGDTIARVLSNSGYIKLLPDMSIRMHGKHEIKTNLDELRN